MAWTRRLGGRSRQSDAWRDVGTETDGAETAETAVCPSPSAADTSPISATTNQPRPRVYLDVRVDGEPAGRIEIELLPEFAPVGAARFADLAEEKGGVGYKQSKWDGIFLERGYVRCAGARSLSYSAGRGGGGGDGGDGRRSGAPEPAGRSGAAGHLQLGVVVARPRERQADDGGLVAGLCFSGLSV